MVVCLVDLFNCTRQGWAPNDGFGICLVIVETVLGRVHNRKGKKRLLTGQRWLVKKPCCEMQACEYEDSQRHLEWKLEKGRVKLACGQRAFAVQRSGVRLVSIFFLVFYNNWHTLETHFLIYKAMKPRGVSEFTQNFNKYISFHFIFLFSIY